MSISNITLSYLVDKLNNSDLVLNCESKQTSSQLLKNINILIFDGLSANASSVGSFVEPENKIVTNDTVTSLGIRSDYDYNEALVYLIFTLFWYSVFVIALIFNQTKKSELQYLEDSQNATKYLLRGTRSEHVKREVLELLKGPGYMQKMNEIYFDNPNQYKIKRFEIKRIKQIDKKLKQYYSSDQNDFYKTFDASQLDDRSKTKSKMDANLFLLKDLHKLDNNSIKNNAINTNQGNLSSNNNHNYNSVSHTTLHSISSSPLLSSNFKANTLDAIKSNRFRVEKISEDV